MISYDDLRDQVRDGDVFLCKDRGPVGITIRVLTGESFNHAALLVWQPGGLWVFEMVEGVGYQVMPASQWIARRGGQVWWGQAPAPARGSWLVSNQAYKHRGAAYGYTSLLRILWSQIIGSGDDAEALVCSTFVQSCWQNAGYDKFIKPADPGDIAEHCASLAPVAK